MKIISILVLFIFFSCSNQTGSSVGNGSTTDTTSVTPPSLPTPIETCTGTIDDGYDDVGNLGRPAEDLIVIGNAMFAGEVGTFIPGGHPQTDPSLHNSAGKYHFPAVNGDSSDDEWMDISSYNWSLNDAFNLLQNDGPIYLRIKVLPQHFPTANSYGCYPRQLNAGRDNTSGYKKLKFTINRHRGFFNEQTQRVERVPNSPGQLVELTEPINVGECSKIIKINQLPSSDPNVPVENQFTFFEITDVRSDYWCQQGADNGLWCPAGRKVGRRSCWRIVVQVATNSTKFFRGHTRN